MASADQTNTGSTTPSSEASVPVDGKGWVDLLANRQSQITNDILELAAQTGMTQQLQNALDAISTISLNAMLHIRTAKFNDTTGTVSTDTSASASPTNGTSAAPTSSSTNVGNGSSNTGA